MIFQFVSKAFELRLIFASSSSTSLSNDELWVWSKVEMMIEWGYRMRIYNANEAAQ